MNGSISHFFQLEEIFPNIIIRVLKDFMYTFFKSYSFTVCQEDRALILKNN